MWIQAAAVPSHTISCPAPFKNASQLHHAYTVTSLSLYIYLSFSLSLSLSLARSFSHSLSLSIASTYTFIRGDRRLSMPRSIDASNSRVLPLLPLRTHTHTRAVHTHELCIHMNISTRTHPSLPPSICFSPSCSVLSWLSR